MLIDGHRTETVLNYTNHLSRETSPYLLQHAANPVGWYPWGPEALEKARAEDKPILLSIGYSACHWCHVMAHESFEDAETAAVMNRLFVNIKVDREERPDLDKIYQTAHALLSQRTGGWPLTMFLTPDRQIPFFGGTYFPDRPRHGLPAFTDLCERVVAFYREHRDEIDRQNASLVDFMSGMNRTAAFEGGTLTAVPLDVARQQLEKQFDAQHGGFGRAPKFPHPTSLERLLRHWALTADRGKPDERALHMALFTLERMALGGMYDQIGGGFCRYSVDDQWMIPHFEKMLYDNGPLLALYAEAFAATGNPFHRRIAAETAGWALREMQSPEGGFYSSLDADSEGEEGRFYVWTRDEVRSLLDADEFTVVELRYGLDRAPNFEGRWHPHAYAGVETIARQLNNSQDAVLATLTSANAKLYAARARRLWPGRDSKVLVSWNALMIKGLAQAARHLGEARCAQAADRALAFIRERMWSDGRLLATYKDGRAHLNAYLDDYVFLADAILELLQVRWRSADLTFALDLLQVVRDRFGDPDGGFFFTADDHERLIQRPKPLTDDALPAGNAVAAKVCARLGHLLGDTALIDAAERTLQAAWQPLQQEPYGHTGLLLALEEYLNPPQTIVIRGDQSQAAPWLAAAAKPYAPRRMTFLIPDDAADLPGLLAERTAGGGTVAYVCSGMSCQAPVRTLDAFRAALAQS